MALLPHNKVFILLEKGVSRTKGHQSPPLPEPLVSLESTLSFIMPPFIERQLSVGFAQSTEDTKTNEM